MLRPGNGPARLFHYREQGNRRVGCGTGHGAALLSAVSQTESPDADLNRRPASLTVTIDLLASSARASCFAKTLARERPKTQRARSE